METLKQKLSSRKLWAAIVGVVVGLAAAFGIDANEYAQVAGIVTSAVSVFAYIFGEAAVDASREKYRTDAERTVNGTEEIKSTESGADDESAVENTTDYPE